MSSEAPFPWISTDTIYPLAATAAINNLIPWFPNSFHLKSTVLNYGLFLIMFAIKAALATFNLLFCKSIWTTLLFMLRIWKNNSNAFKLLFAQMLFHWRFIYLNAIFVFNAWKMSMNPVGPILLPLISNIPIFGYYFKISPKVLAPKSPIYMSWRVILPVGAYLSKIGTKVATP